MKVEYDTMQTVMTESRGKIEELKKSGEKLTVKKDINANKREVKMKEADLNYAKKRSEELKSQYDTMMADK